MGLYSSSICHVSIFLKDWLLVSWTLSLSLVQVLEHVCPHPQTPKSMSRHPRNGTTHTWETGSATADEQSLDGFGPSLHLLEARNARRHVSDIQSVGMWSWRGSGSSLAPIAARSPLQLASGLAEAHAGPGLVGPSLPDVFQPSGLLSVSRYWGLLPNGARDYRGAQERVDGDPVSAVSEMGEGTWMGMHLTGPDVGFPKRGSSDKESLRSVILQGHQWKMMSCTIPLSLERNSARQPSGSWSARGPSLQSLGGLGNAALRHVQHATVTSLLSCGKKLR